MSLSIDIGKVLETVKRKKRRTKYRRDHNKGNPLLPPKTGAFGEIGTVGKVQVYDAKFHCRLAYRLSLLNLSDAEMCVPMDVSLETFRLWKRDHPEFLMALERGQEQADAKVARALFRRAVGWGTLEEHIVTKKVKDAEGNEQVEIVKVPRRRQLPPDVNAISLWLKNRRPRQWKTDNSTTPINPIQMNINLNSFSLKELRLAQKLGFHTMKQLPSEAVNDDTE